MTYRPKLNEDAITRDGNKAVLVSIGESGNDLYPFEYHIEGGSDTYFYGFNGRCGALGHDHPKDLVGKWEDPQPKAKKLKWVKVAKGLTVAGGYDIAKRDVDFELTCFDMESRGSTYLGIFPTKKAAKAAAQEDADKL